MDQGKNILQRLDRETLFPIFRVIGAIGIATVLLRFSFFSLEGPLFDARTRYSYKPNPSGNIVTIALDQRTINEMGGDPNAADYQKVVENIFEARPLKVIFLLDPSKWTGSLYEKKSFVATVAKKENFLFATEQIIPSFQNRFLKLPEPFENLTLASAPITRDNITFSEDKVTRRALVAFEGQTMLQPQLASLFNGMTDPKSYRGVFESDGSFFTYIRYRNPGTYKAISLIDVINGKVAPQQLASKIVLVGIDNQIDTDDYILTPFSKYPLAMSRLEAQANIIDTFIQNNGLAPAPAWFDFILTLLMAHLTLVFLWTVRPVEAIGLLLAQASLFLVGAYAAFSFFGVWINATHPLLAVFVSYYFFLPYRLILENRRSWEYFQKNRILTQVEELKTNFLSMMSHDLKTPIARIQGMAEIALTDGENLNAPQKEALGTIIRSTEELGRFIGSILDLSRIESKEVKLHKTSRDINTLLAEVIKKYEFQAKAKNITIQSNLDPLFSIKVDADLIRQVFINLVENAIKYCPTGSAVTISSKEESGNIKVLVSDTGPGISAEELNNIFLKFYRSKDAKSSPIKGSGLGLYLAKYFAELHGGDITVESIPMKGSTFTVQLPVS